MEGGAPRLAVRSCLGPARKKVITESLSVISLSIHFSLSQPLQTLPYGALPFAGRTVGIHRSVMYSLQKLKMPRTHRAHDETSIRLQKTFQSSPRIIPRPIFRISTLRRRPRSPCDGDLRMLSESRDRSSFLPDLWPVARNLARPPQSTGLS